MRSICVNLIASEIICDIWKTSKNLQNLKFKANLEFGLILLFRFSDVNFNYLKGI